LPVTRGTSPGRLPTRVLKQPEPKSEHHCHIIICMHMLRLKCALAGGKNILPEPGLVLLSRKETPLSRAAIGQMLKIQTSNKERSV